MSLHVPPGANVAVRVTKELVHRLRHQLSKAIPIPEPCTLEMERCLTALFRLEEAYNDELRDL